MSETQNMEAETEDGTETPRIIEHMSVLDFSTLKNASDLEGISAIRHVAIIIIPKELVGALSKIPMQHVANILPIAAGAKLKQFMGQNKLTGAAFATAKEDEIWVMCGQTHITTPVENFTGRELHILGQIMAPRGSEEALAGAITTLQGQVVYAPVGARLLMGHESWGREFFELLPEPSAFCIMGQLSIEGDVTVDLLKTKVTEIVLFGHVEAPRSLVPLLQVLTVENLGQISAKE